MSEHKWEYRALTRKELEWICAKNIADNPQDPMWEVWMDGNLKANADGRMLTFAALRDGVPIGEGTVIFSADCVQIGGRTDLADGIRTANVNGLRIPKEYEGQGHISRMMRAMEEEVRRRGIPSITIGVEAQETRNLGIYLHWGYNRLVRHDIEDGLLVLYYAKDLS